jgi:hypothetical protein
LGGGDGREEALKVNGVPCEEHGVTDMSRNQGEQARRGKKRISEETLKFWLQFLETEDTNPLTDAEGQHQKRNTRHKRTIFMENAVQNCILVTRR